MLAALEHACDQSCPGRRAGEGDNLMVEVRIQQAALDVGVKMVFKEFASCVRVAHDPRALTEPEALELLRHHLPRARGELQIVRCPG